MGLGAGSWPAEFARFDVGQQDPKARVAQLARHLELIKRYWGDDGRGEAQARDARIRYRWCWAEAARG